MRNLIYSIQALAPPYSHISLLLSKIRKTSQGKTLRLGANISLANIRGFNS